MDTKCDCLPRFVKVENSSRKDEGFSEAIAWKSAQKFFGFRFSSLFGQFQLSWVDDVWGDDRLSLPLNREMLFLIGDCFFGRSVVDGNVTLLECATFRQHVKKAIVITRVLFCYFQVFL
jgi:hypothetical protein